MKKNLFLMIVICLTSLNVMAISNPINDDCSDAITIVNGQSVSGSTETSSLFSQFSCYYGSTYGKYGVWYKFVGHGADVEFNTTGSGYDTFLDVYKGECGSLECVIGDDDGLPSRLSKVEFFAENNTDYYIYMTGWSQNKGAYVLNCIEALPIEKSKEADFLSFSVPNQIGETIIEESNIYITVPFGNMQNNEGLYSMPLVPSFQVSTASRGVYVTNEVQVSGQSAIDFAHSVLYKVLAEDESVEKYWRVWIKEQERGAALGFSSFSINGQVSPTVLDVDNRSIEIVVSYGTDITNIAATFDKAPDDASVYVNDVTQNSGSSINDFSNYVQYRVVTEDGLQEEIWTVKVSKAMPSSELFDEDSNIYISGQYGETTFSNDTAYITMPNQNPLTNLRPNFYMAPGATVKYNGNVVVNGQTSINLSEPASLIVTSEDQTKSKLFTLVVMNAELYSDAYVNYGYFYAGGFSNNSSSYSSYSFSVDRVNKRIYRSIYYRDELRPDYYNFRLELSNYTKYVGDNIYIEYIYSNGNSRYYLLLDSDVTEIDLIAQDGTIDTYTVEVIRPAETANTNISNLRWYSNGWKYFSKDYENGILNYNFPYGTSLSNIQLYIDTYGDNRVYIDGNRIRYGYFNADLTNDFEIDVFASDGETTRTWVVRANVAEATSVGKFNSFTLPGQIGNTIYDNDKKEIRLSVNSNTDISNIAPNFTIDYGMKVYVSGDEQLNGSSKNNFNGVATYFVLAQDGVSMTSWKVYVTQLPPSSEAQINSFNINGLYGTIFIDENKVYVPNEDGVDLSSMQGYFSLSPGAKAYYGGEEIVSGSTAIDYSLQPIFINVVSEDYSTSKQWEIVIVDDLSTILLSGINYFNIEGQISSEVDDELGEIRVLMPATSMASEVRVDYNPLYKVNTFLNGDIIKPGLKTASLIDGSDLVLQTSSGEQREYRIDVEYFGVATDLSSVVKSSVKLYPNPADDFIIVEVEDDQVFNIKLTSISGVVVKDEKGIGSISINTSGLSSGVYSAEIIVDNTVVSEKVIIE